MQEDLVLASASVADTKTGGLFTTVRTESAFGNASGVEFLGISNLWCLSYP